MTDTQGAVTTKADHLRDARVPAVNYIAFCNGEMHVQFFGNTAIVRDRKVVQGTTRAGARVDVLVRFTDTGVLLNGHWQLIAGHDEGSHVTQNADDGEARLVARTAVYQRAPRQLIDSIGPRLSTIAPTYAERVRLDKATVLAHRVYASRLDSFELL